MHIGSNCAVARTRRVISSKAILFAVVAALSAPAFAATYNFIPGAGTTAPGSVNGSSGDWNVGGNWATSTTTGTLPGSSDQASSSSGATTVVDSADGPVAELRFANNAPGAAVNTVNSQAYTATGTATLTIASGGSLTISGTGTLGNCTIGNSAGASGTLIFNGGSMSTSSTGTGETLGGLASVVLGNTSSSTTLQGPTGTLQMNSGTMNVGNNLILGFGSSLNTDKATADTAKGNATQTGGIINVTGAIMIGAKGLGTYSISGGQLNQLGTNGDINASGRDAFYLGQQNTSGNAGQTSLTGGQGTFTQSGTAAVTIANGLYIANQSNTTGIYTVSGGSLSIAGPISVGAASGAGVGTSTVATGQTNNLGRFQVNGNSATSITAQHMTADTANSILGFGIGSSSGTTPILISAGGSHGAGFADGEVALTASTTVDIDPLAGYVPAPGSVYTLITADGFDNGSGVVPTLVGTGGFAGSTLSIVLNSDSTFSLIDTVAATPEPATLSLLVLPALLLGRRNRRSSLA